MTFWLALMNCLPVDHLGVHDGGTLARRNMHEANHEDDRSGDRTRDPVGNGSGRSGGGRAEVPLRNWSEREQIRLGLYCPQPK